MIRDPSKRWTVPYPTHGSDEWLDLRKPYANASSCAVHVDEHEYETVADWAVGKLTGIGRDPTRAMIRGTRLEGAIRDWYADELGVAIVVPDVMYGYGRLLGTPDGHIVGTTEGIEVKARDRGLLRCHYWQCQAVMLATGWTRMHLVRLADDDLVVDIIPASVVDQGRLYEAIEDDMAWLDMGMVPERATLTFKHQSRLHPDVAEPRVELGDDIADIVEDYRRVAEQIRALYARQDGNKAVLAGVLGDAEAGYYPGSDRPAVTWKVQARSTIDADALRADHPKLAAKYERHSTFRVMRVA